MSVLNRRVFLFLLALSGLAAPAVSAVEVPVTVTVDSRSSASDSSRLETPNVSAAWLQWGRMAANSVVFTPTVLPQNAAAAQATRSVGEASVLIVSSPGGAGLQARAAASLEAGLYRVAAVVIDAPTDPTAAPTARAWRMESVLLPRPGVSAKTIHLRPGQTVIVRWTETISEARSMLQDARRSEAAQGGPTTYTGVTIAKALGQAGRFLGEVQTLTARGSRPDAIRRTHLALIYIAQAQAMARNRPGAAAGDSDDTTFARLTTAFSEISAALGNLVPTEAVTAGKDGLPSEVRVSVTNAGKKTVPFVTLALPASVDAAQAVVESRRRAFRNIAPGATVSARFPITPSFAGPASPASTVQFIQGVGAAVVTAAPPP